MRHASLWVKLYILSLLTQCLSQNNGPKDWQRNCRLYLKCQDHQNKINPHMREHLLAFTFIYVTFLLLDGLWTTIHCLQMSPTSVFYPHNNIFYFFSGLTSPYYMAAKKYFSQFEFTFNIFCILDPDHDFARIILFHCLLDVRWQ